MRCVRCSEKRCISAVDASRIRVSHRTQADLVFETIPVVLDATVGQRLPLASIDSFEEILSDSKHTCGKSSKLSANTG